jgi:hypothetical protein
MEDGENFINEDRHDMQSSPHIIRVIKSRTSSWKGTWHVWKRSGYSFLVGSLKERDHFEELGTDRIILK